MEEQKVNAPLANGFSVQEVNESVTALIFRLLDNSALAVSVSNKDYSILVSMILEAAQKHAAKHQPENKQTGELTAKPLLVSAVGVAPHSETEALLVMHLGNLTLPFLVDLATLLGMCKNLQGAIKVTPPKPAN